MVGGLLAAGALSYAELAAALPEAGGNMRFCARHGPLWGFIYSWTQMWVARADPSPPWPPVSFSPDDFFEPLKVNIYTIPLLLLAQMGTPDSIRPGIRHFPDSGAGLAELFRRLIGGNVQVAVTVIKVALIAANILAGLAPGMPMRPKPRPYRSLSGFIAAGSRLGAYDG